MLIVKTGGAQYLDSVHLNLNANNNNNNKVTR